MAECRRRFERQAVVMSELIDLIALYVRERCSIQEIAEFLHQDESTVKACIESALREVA